MADGSEQVQTEQSPLQAQADIPDSFTQEQVKNLLSQAMEQGRREGQSTKDREIAQRDKTINELQTLANFQNLSAEEQEGLGNLAETQRSVANAWAKAHNLSSFETRYLATLPISAQELEAERIIAERSSEASGLLEKMTTSTANQASPQGFADTALPPTGGSRPPSGDFKSLDAGLDALSKMDVNSPEAKALWSKLTENQP